MNVEYAVKVICGKSEGTVAAPGAYWTAVNVHNPLDEAVGFRWKVAVALPHTEPGPVSKLFDARLGPDEAFEIDCGDILERADAGDFVKGFVVIQSRTDLDVVAVYSAAGRDETVTAIDIERVAGRRLQRGLPDLVPVPDENGNFCRREGSELTVTVRNQGTGPAGASLTEVDFGRHGRVAQPTPALVAGASADLKFAIPLGCHDPDCQFTITVDANNDVAEADESNNVASGICLG